MTCKTGSIPRPPVDAPASYCPPGGRLLHPFFRTLIMGVRPGRARLPPSQGTQRLGGSLALPDGLASSWSLRAPSTTPERSRPVYDFLISLLHPYFLLLVL